MSLYGDLPPPSSGGSGIAGMSLQLLAAATATAKAKAEAALAKQKELLAAKGKEPAAAQDAKAATTTTPKKIEPKVMIISSAEKLLPRKLAPGGASTANALLNRPSSGPALPRALLQQNKPAPKPPAAGLKRGADGKPLVKKSPKLTGASGPEAFYLPKAEHNLNEDGSTAADPNASSSASSSSAAALTIKPQDEYNPAKPNDYERFVAEREAVRYEQQQQRRREREERDLQDEIERREEERAVQLMAEAAGEQSQSAGLGFGSSASASASAASSSDLAPKVDLKVSSGEEAFLRRQRMSAGGGAAIPPPPAPSTAPEQSAPKRQKVDRGISATPTRCVLLQNLVGRGGVDPELEGETAEECRKWGSVKRCQVHTCSDADLDDEEAVRVFVLFDDEESAKKAVAGMNGRFFAGRTVRASFAAEDRFQAGSLSP